MVKTNWKTKVALFLLFSLGYCIFYILPNFYPFFPPVMLPRLMFDKAMPFLPWTFFIYLSDYVFIYLAIVALHGEEFESFARQMFAALVMCGAFFMFFPTTYPRPEYPEVSNVLLAMAMYSVKVGDMPTNCFPSMHVALTGVCMWNLRRKANPAFAIFFVWTILIFISTMTTKQHYFVDILGGIGILIASAWLERIYAANAVTLKSLLPAARKPNTPPTTK